MIIEVLAYTTLEQINSKLNLLEINFENIALDNYQISIYSEIKELNTRWKSLLLKMNEYN